MSFFPILTDKYIFGPTRVMASSFLRFLDHTQRRTTVVGLFWTRDQHLAETSIRQRTTLSTEETSMPLVGFETLNPIKRMAAEPRLKPRDHLGSADTFIHGF
jgi:hypothetical protein